MAWRPAERGVWRVGAVVRVADARRFAVRPVYRRASEHALDDPSVCDECFVNWDSELKDELVQAGEGSLRVLDFSYEERIVQCRVENPHGEHSEICYRIPSNDLSSDMQPIPIL